MLRISLRLQLGVSDWEVALCHRILEKYLTSGEISSKWSYDVLCAEIKYEAERDRDG